MKICEVKETYNIINDMAEVKVRIINGIKLNFTERFYYDCFNSWSITYRQNGIGTEVARKI